MTRSTLVVRRTATRCGLAVVVCALSGFVQSQAGGAELKDLIYKRYPQPVGLLRPNSYFGFFPTQWQPWQFAAVPPDTTSVGRSAVQEGNILPAPMPIAAPPKLSTSPPTPPIGASR